MGSWPSWWGWHPLSWISVQCCLCDSAGAGSPLPGELWSQGALPRSSAESPDEAGAGDQESEDDLSASRTSLERQAPHRGNTMVHVCWHRNTSVSMVDFSVAVEVSAGHIWGRGEAT